MPKLAKLNTPELTRQILATGGFTYSVKHGISVGAGYAVANPPGALSVQVLNPTPELIAQAIETAAFANRFLLNADGYCLGAWMDGAKLYVEVSEVYPSSAEGAKEAIAVAKERGELAVFALHLLQEVRIAA